MASLLGRTFCSHISTMLSDLDGLLVGHVLAILTARATGRSSLCVLGCPGAAKTFALWCSLLCLDAALDHRVLWTSQQHSALLAVVGIATNLLKDAPRWLQRLLVVRRVSGDGPVISTTHDHVAFVAAAVSAGIGEPQGRTTAKNIHHDHPAVAEPPSVKNARMLVLTQASCVPQLLRTWPNDVSNFVASANTMITDEGQQEGHPEVVAVLAMAKHMLIIRTGDPQQPTGGGHEEVQIATIGRLLSKPVGIRGIARSPLRPIRPMDLPSALESLAHASCSSGPRHAMRWPHLGRRLGMTQLCPPPGAPIAICIYLGLDREVRGQLLEDRPNQQGCLVQFFQDAFLIPYVAIVELNEQRCPHYPRLSKEDITIDFLPQPSSDSLSLLQYVSRLAAVGVTLRRAENANQAEGTSIRYPHSISWYTEAPSPSPKIQVGSVAASSADRWLARTDAAGGHQRGVRFVRLRPGQWEGPALFKLALLLLVEVYQLSGHRIAAEPGSKIVLVTPTRRVHAHFITALGLSNATTASINGGEARRAAFVGTTLRAFVETGLPDLPAPGHLRAADAQTLFEYFRDHQWELGAFIDLHTATVCAGPRAQWTFLWSTLWAGSLSTVRTLCKGLPQVPHAQQARCLSPLPPIAGEPWLPWSYTLRCMAQWSVMRTSLGRMVCPLEWICRPIRIMRLCKSFMTNGRLICNRAIRTRAQCWHGRPVRPHHRASCCCSSPINEATRFFGDLFCLHFSVSIH